jgi:chromosome segregation ATPase
LEVQYNNLTEQEGRLQDKLNRLSDFFLKRGEMDAVLSSGQFLSRLEEERNRYHSERDSITERIKSIEGESQHLDLEVVKTEGEINRRTETQKTLESWLESYQHDLSELEKRAAGFGKSTVGEYREGLRLLIHQESLRKLELEIEAGRTRRKKQLSGDSGYYVPNEEILSLAGKLNDKCEFVQTGVDWIAQAAPEEKENILRRMPYLPFSVITDRRSFDKLKNGRIKPDFASDYPVPVVNLEAVRLVNDGNREDIYYFCSFAGLLLDSGRYSQYIQGLEAALKTLDGEIIAADTRINELNQDLSGVDVFYGRYPRAEVDNKKKTIITIKDEIAAFQKSLRKLNEKKDNLLQERNVLGVRLEELAGLTAAGQEKIDKLLDRMETENSLAEIRKQLSLNKKELGAVREKIGGIKDAALILKQKCDAVDDRLNSLIIELHEVKKEREGLLSYTEIENTLAIAQGRAEFNALLGAVSGRSAEESDLRSSLEENETRLDALKDRILRDYEGDLAEVEKSEENGLQIIIPTRSMIYDAKQKKDSHSKELEAANEKVTKIRLAVEKTAGKLEEILKGLGEDFKGDLPRYDSEGRYQREIEQAEQLLKSYADKIGRANEELDRIKEEYGRLNNQKEDYEDFLERENVTGDGTVAAEAKEYRQFEKNTAICGMPSAGRLRNGMPG